MGSDDRKEMIKIRILGFSLTSILILVGVLWYLGWLPIGSSSDGGEDYYMANTALLANNMLAMEYEMVNDNQDVNVHKQLRETALATAVLLKKLTSDKTVPYAELRTALKANCIVLKREYKLEEILKDDKDLEKVMKEAFAECTKGFQIVKARKTDRVKKLLQTTEEIYKDALDKKNNEHMCITVFNHAKTMLRAMKVGLMILQTEHKGSKYTPDKDLQSKFRNAGKTALLLHAKTTGTCKKIKIDKLAKADMKIKMLLNNENILATGKDLDGNNPFQMIEDPEKPAGKTSKEDSGSHNKHLLLITSLVFGGSFIGCIVVGFSLPKPGPRTPHMSAGKSYPDDDSDPEEIPAYKKIKDFLVEMYPGVKAGTVWILSNGWYVTKSTAGLVYNGVIYLKDKWNSKDVPEEAKFPFASARSQQVYGSVKGAILSLYDRSKYYGNGLYKLYKQNKTDKTEEYDYSHLLLSDGEEDVIFTTEEEKSCTEDDKSSGDEIEEIPEDEESCIEPAEKSIEQIEDNIKEIKEKINNKMNRIEEAFKANDQTEKEKSKVISVEAEVHQETQNEGATDEYTYTYNTEGEQTEGDYTENTYTADDLSPRDDQSADHPPDIPEKDYH